jgi:hypothetical protein
MIRWIMCSRWRNSLRRSTRIKIRSNLFGIITT